MSSPTVEGGGRGGRIPRAAPDTTRRQQIAAQWRRRSRIIRVLRRALPALIILIGLSLAGWVIYNAVAWRFGPAQSGGVSIRMIKPKFYGRDSSNAPYVITADSAARDEIDLQRVEMTKPTFMQNVGAPTESTLRALVGVFREDTRILRLEKDLVVTDKRGYRFTADRAVVDTKTGSIEGESAIEGMGPLGRISASSYAVSPGGKQMFFRGNVHARIERASPSAAR